MRICFLDYHVYLYLAYYRQVEWGTKSDQKLEGGERPLYIAM